MYEFVHVFIYLFIKYMHTCVCREMVVAADLPMPITWYSMPFRVDVPKGGSTLLCHYIKEDETRTDSLSVTVNAEAKSVKILSKVGQKILNSDVLRVQWVDKEEAEVVVTHTVDYGTPQEMLRLNNVLTIEDIDGETVQKLDRDLTSLPSSATSSSSSSASSISVCGEISITDKWNLSSQLSSKVYKKDRAGRKQPYVDLLVAKELALKGTSQQAGSSSSSSGGKGGGSGMHEGGFATLYRLMAGEQVGCPLCLEVGHLLTHSLTHSRIHVMIMLWQLIIVLPMSHHTHIAAM